MIANFSFGFLIGGAKMVIQWRWDELVFGKVAFSFSISNLFLTFVTAIGVVLFPSLKRMEEDQLPNLYVKIRDTISPLLFYVMLLYFPGCWILEMWLPAYSESLVYIGILLPIIIFSTKVSLLTNNYLKAYRKEKMMLLINVISVVIGFVLFLLGSYVFSSLDFVLYSTVFVIMLRSIASEVAVMKCVKKNFTLDYIVEFVMTVAFVAIVQLLSLWWACLAYFGVLVVYSILYRKRKNGALTGHVFALTALSQEADMSGEIISATDYVLNQCKKLDMAALDVLENQYTLRLKDSTEKLFVSVLVEMEKLGKALVDCTGLFRELIESIDEELRDSAPVWETKSVLRRLESMAQLCKNFVSWSEKEETVFFIEKARSSSQGVGESPVFCRFIQAPLHVSYKMNEGIFETMDSVVCTSATIKSGNSFNYWLQRSGICFADQERVYVKDFESPFPYDRNMLMAIPQDIPFPDSRDYFAYIEKAVSQLILAVGGKTLVLFTSYEALRSTWEGVRALLVGSGITVLKQGDDDRFRLLEHFKTDISSVLFATDSFWEGVDVPGESLSQVIIAKLPFSVPSDPIFAARCENERRLVQISFRDVLYDLLYNPDTTLFMKKGSDQGAVVKNGLEMLLLQAFGSWDIWNRQL